MEEDDIPEDEDAKEIFEYWLVSGWFAEKLLEKNQPILQIDNLNIWGRCTTGQAIALDRVIRDIAVEVFGGEKTS